MPQPDYDNMSDEELEGEFAKSLAEEDNPQQEPEQPAVGDPDPPAQAEAEDTAEQSPTEPVDDVPPNGEATTTEPVEADVDERDDKIEELQLQLKQVELERQKFHFDRQREAGLVGTLHQRLDSIEGVLSGRNQPEETGYEGDDPQPKPTAKPLADPRVEEMLQEHKEARIRASYETLERQMRQDVTRELVEPTPEQVSAEVESRLAAISPIIQKNVQQYAGQNLNANAASKVFEQEWGLAYGEFKLSKLKERNATRRATQVSASRRAKIAATDDTGSSPIAAPRAKSVEDMTIEEIDAELERQHGSGNRYRER